MVTIFAIPKPFEGQFAVIQRNAIQSWTLLRPRPEVLLFGDEKGTEEICQELGCRHVRAVARNEYGTPLINDMFEQAQRLATHPCVCYVNADIILLSDFAAAGAQAMPWRPRFLMIGRRWDLDLSQPLDFSRADWEQRLRAVVRERGVERDAWPVDYFFFPSGCFPEVPPFAIGRYSWDSWLVWKARTTGIPLLDASAVVLAVHQNHATLHHPGLREGILESDEAKKNFQLAGGHQHLGRIDDASYLLTPSGIRRNFSLDHWARRLGPLWPWLMRTTAPVRHRLGLRRRRNISLRA